MKNFALSLLGAAALLSPRFCSAEETASTGPDAAALFKQLDVDQNGQITAAEVPEDKKRLFERLLRNADSNADGQLDPEEFAAGLKNSRPERPFASPDDVQGPGAIFEGDPQAFFKQLDKNGDGKITLQEVPEEGRARFQMMLGRFDENGDGELSQAEFNKAAEMIARYRGQVPGQRPDGAGLAGEALLRALDTNGDGVLSSGEIDAAVESLRKLDRNGDGQITRDELAPPPGRPGAGGRPGEAAIGPEAILERFKQADANGDGKISREEAPDRLKENFDQVDANKDGFLDETELKAVAGRLAGGPGRPGEGQPGPGAEEFMKRIKEADKDGDGKLSRDEAPERLKQRFDEIDKNKDGFIDQQEIRQAMQAMFGGKRPEGQRPGGPQPGGAPGKRPQGQPGQGGGEELRKKFQESDKNGDGKLSREEAPERLKQKFDEIDTNKDGQLDPQELQQFHGKGKRDGAGKFRRKKNEV